MGILQGEVNFLCEQFVQPKPSSYYDLLPLYIALYHFLVAGFSMNLHLIIKKCMIENFP